MLAWGELAFGERRTSDVSVLSASQSSRGSMFVMKSGFNSVSIFSNSASFGWRGKAAGEDLQDFRAQVRKLRVRSFILILLRFFLLDLELRVGVVRLL